jgi:hypothetical protein
VFDGIDPTDIV